MCCGWVGGVCVERGGVWTRESPPLFVPSSLKWKRTAATAFHAHMCADLRCIQTQFMTLSSPLKLIYWCFLVAVKKIFTGFLRLVCERGFDLSVMWTHSLRRREDKTTETDDAAMAAEPIQGWRTSPAGINTPGNTKNKVVWDMKEKLLSNEKWVCVCWCHSPAAIGMPSKL